MAKIWKPQRNHHKLEALQKRALFYFDTNSQKWTYSQRRAALALEKMFKSFKVMRWRYKRITPAQMSTFICLVGRLFFMDSLTNVKFEWHDDPATWPHGAHDTAVSTTDSEKASAIISFNLSHPNWRRIRASKRRQKVVGTLLHETIHVYLERHCKEEDRDGTTGHGAAWQMISEAVKWYAEDLLGVNFHLNRSESLLLEYEEYGRVDLSQEELRHCFGEDFWYFPATNALSIIEDDVFSYEVVPFCRDGIFMIELDVFSYEVITFWRDMGSDS